MSREREKGGKSTDAVHGGERDGRPRVSDSLTTPIVQSATYWFRDTQEVIAYQEGRHPSFEYGRYGNPTTRVLEEKLCLLEGGEDCVVSASGMNSVTTLLLALLPQNGHLVTTHDCYRRTRQFISELLPRMGVRTTVIDPADYAGLARALADGASLFFSESPTNPYLRVIDMSRVAELCRPSGATVVIDSTFATPINQQALALGADLVLHSATKYLAGHNDVMGGALVGKRGADREDPQAPRCARRRGRPARVVPDPARGEDARAARRARERDRAARSRAISRSTRRSSACTTRASRATASTRSRCDR